MLRQSLPEFHPRWVGTASSGVCRGVSAWLRGRPVQKAQQGQQPTQALSSGECGKVGYPFDSGDHNILWLAIGGPRKGLPIAPRFQACDGHGACVILDRPETQPRGPIACRPASGAPGCILGAVCWRPWIDQTTTPRGYLSQVDTPFAAIQALAEIVDVKDRQSMGAGRYYVKEEKLDVISCQLPSSGIGSGGQTITRWDSTLRGMHLTPDDPTPCGRRLRRPHPRGAIGQRSWVL